MSDNESKRGAKGWASIMLFAAVIGLADASYLAASHWFGQLPTCQLTGGCTNVLASPYAKIGAIPVAYLGVSYYLTVGLLLVSYFASANNTHLRWAARLTIVGLVASSYFGFVMAIILREYCQYCLISAISSTLLFAGGMMALRKLRRLDEARVPLDA